MKIYAEIEEGKSKKTGKNYIAVCVHIGDWSTLVFPRSNFELNYIKNVLAEVNQ